MSTFSASLPSTVARKLPISVPTWSDILLLLAPSLSDEGADRLRNRRRQIKEVTPTETATIIGIPTPRPTPSPIVLVDEYTASASACAVAAARVASSIAKSRQLWGSHETVAVKTVVCAGSVEDVEEGKEVKRALPTEVSTDVRAHCVISSKSSKGSVKKSLSSPWT